VQSVQYSANFVYATTQGIPSYVVGPYLDGNPSQATNQNAIFKFPLTPVQNTATAVSTPVGILVCLLMELRCLIIVMVFLEKLNWRICWWSDRWREMVFGTEMPFLHEKAGFDCSKGHPAMELIIIIIKTQVPLI
jgi:hypothetical protein